MKILFKVNNKPIEVDVEPYERLVDLIREKLYLTGTKEGCGEGECGACTVLVDGKPVNSCLVPARAVHGKEVETIEGIREKPEGKALIKAFGETGAVQCGFCTPGIIVSAFYLLKTKKEPKTEEIKECLSGHLCRCTGYKKIIEAVKRAYEILYTV